MSALAQDREIPSAASPCETAEFKVREAREFVSDLFAPKPAVYWSDFLASAALFYCCAFLYVRAAPWSIQQILMFLLAGTTLLRCAIFIHEIVHMRKGTMPLFKLVWNM